MLASWSFLLPFGAVVFCGAAVQRLAGIGFGLVSAPFLVLLVGPMDGVALANCAGVAISGAGLAATWRRVRLRAMVPLVAAAAVTVPLGATVARRLPEPVLLTAMGALLTLLVLLLVRGVRVPVLRGTAGAVAAGAASGFMNSSAGLGGPAVSLYAVNAGWTAREFVPNAQFYGLVVNVFSLVAKGTPHLTRPVWLLGAAALSGGLVAGHLLAARTSEHRARRVVLALALGGGLVTLAKGIGGLSAT
ncbi:sulfite exporter TauE/SafE family protein [Streptomyces sp. TRM 70351]|uniref:sulfite exporter TauE/SafE family protein n=1 Tax=Streptomyces sp. TRM 70351 TaxID=3116552 RepID=UPI002E7AB29E|nr:sulfite exporter TauE/SafE family protein [Streptomyces sp. TRM 70351]MEE1928359.1 sulfite exporter TauE/SafE family protein [Streptomyces sp. TRM 70351]